jgi:hypothetical protein
MYFRYFGGFNSNIATRLLSLKNAIVGLPSSKCYFFFSFFTAFEKEELFNIMVCYLNDLYLAFKLVFGEISLKLF